MKYTIIVVKTHEGKETVKSWDFNSPSLTTLVIVATSVVSATLGMLIALTSMFG